MSVTDDASSEAQERLVNSGISIPADAEATKLMEPTECAFDEPPLLAQAAFGIAAFRDLRLDAEPAEQSSQRGAVEGFVGHECIRFLFGPAGLAGHLRNLDDQGQRGVHVVPIGLRHLHHQRHALGVGQQAMFSARTPTIRGIRPCF